MGIQSTNSSAGSRYRTSTICARVGRTGRGGWFIRPPGQCRSASAREGNQTHKAGPGTCEWTRCIKGTVMELRGCTTSNAVDEVAQWQMVGATEQISEAWLLPV